MVTTSTKALLRDVLFASQAIRSNRIMTALNHILFDFTGGILSVQGTDGNLFIRRIHECNTKSRDCFGVPVKPLTDFLKSAPSAEVELSLEGNSMLLVSGTARAEIHTIAKAEFPEPPAFTGWEVSMACDLLATRLRQVAFAQSTDVSMPTRHGVGFEFKGGTLNLVAILGNLVAVSEIAMPEAEDAEYIVPSFIINPLISALESTDGDIKIVFSENRVLFTTDDWTFTGSLIDGRLPNWRAPIPTGAVKHNLKVVRAEFTEAMKRAKLFTSEIHFPVRMDWMETSVKLQSGSGTQKFSETVSAEASELTMAINPDYVLQTIGSLKGETVTINTEDEMSPIVIKEDGFLCVMMGCRVN